MSISQPFHNKKWCQVWDLMKQKEVLEGIVGSLWAAEESVGGCGTHFQIQSWKEIKKFYGVGFHFNTLQ